MVDANLYLKNDTIAAVSTPPGRGAVAVIRISGPDAIGLCQRVFRARGGKEAFSPRKMTLGQVIDPHSQEVVDEALAVIFRGPHSFTGEDMAEIHGHGGEAVVRRVLTLVLREGARAAEAGEFSFRAVRQGKMDLTQAEAIAALIDSRSQLARSLSLRMLAGAFSRELAQLREALISVLVELETTLEFPDDAMEETLCEALEARVDWLLQQADGLAQRAVREQRFEQGILAVLAGRPNVGKSSLFNRLLGRDRAIVTPHPGTTRDTLEGTIEIEGRPLTLVDTAGLRETQEAIEAIGIERSRALLTSSHIVLFILDAQAGLQDEERRVLAELAQREGGYVIVILNKQDLGGLAAVDAQALGAQQVVSASALEEDGIEALLQALTKAMHTLMPADADSAYLISARQEQQLVQLRSNLAKARQLLQDRAPLELASQELRDALQPIAELDGSGMAPDLMTVIFSRFCIGK